jgi:CRP/FNR family transcriptional regulator, anaerobic regulatory protein
MIARGHAASPSRPCVDIGHPCDDCEIRAFGVCGSLGDNDLDRLRRVVRIIQCEPDEVIFREGDPAGFLFNVVAGAVRIYKLLPDGRRQIVGFLVAGDFLGLAFNDTYGYTAEAIGAARLCRVKRTEYEGLLAELPGLEKRLLSNESDELTAAQDQMLLLGRKSAKEKLATFLMQLSERAGRRGGDGVLELPMVRADIADYLGLTIETVSRTISLFKRDGLIRLLPDNRMQLTRRDLLDHLRAGD